MNIIAGSSVACEEKFKMSVLQVGTGVIAIAVVWIASLVLGILLLRASGSTK